VPERQDRLCIVRLWSHVHVLHVRPDHLAPAAHVPHLPPGDQGRRQGFQGDPLRAWLVFEDDCLIYYALLCNFLLFFLARNYRILENGN